MEAMLLDHVLNRCMCTVGEMALITSHHYSWRRTLQSGKLKEVFDNLYLPNFYYIKHKINNAVSNHWRIRGPTWANIPAYVQHLWGHFVLILYNYVHHTHTHTLYRHISVYNTSWNNCHPAASNSQTFMSLYLQTWPLLSLWRQP